VTVGKGLGDPYLPSPAMKRASRRLSGCWVRVSGDCAFARTWAGRAGTRPDVATGGLLILASSVEVTTATVVDVTTSTD